LRRAFADKLPNEIATRGKQGFSVPIGLWLQRELRHWLRARLLDDPRLPTYFRRATIETLFDEHDRGVSNHQKRLWALLIFALWMERYLP
jgi:asparagine synthase (glutamine-hydrolysing)